jgi:hypothetical protein
MGRGREQQAIANGSTYYLFYGKMQGTTGNCYLLYLLFILWEGVRNTGNF